MPHIGSAGMRCCLAVIILYFFAPLVSRASDFREVATAHFVFYFHVNDAKLMKSLIDQSEELRREITGNLGIDFEEKTRVYLSPSSGNFQAIQPGGKIPCWSAGVAYPAISLIIIKSPRAAKGKRINVKKIFMHEFTHIALGKAFRGREKVPRWLNEGLAMYESREWDPFRVSAMTRAVLKDALIPLSEITHSFPREEDRAELAYSESFYFISFLIGQYGKKNFHSFIKEYSRGKELQVVLAEVYGIGWEELEERWKKYLKLRFSWIPILLSSTTLWFLLTLLFLAGYLKKKRANRRKLKEWEREESSFCG